MEVVNKIILAVIQGITELLPVSSSGHLTIASEILNFEIDFTFLLFLHLFTGLAILIGFWKEIKSVLVSKERKYLIKIFLVAILPAGIVGIILRNPIEQYLHNSLTIVLSMLIIVGMVMILVDYFYYHRSKVISEINFERINFKIAAVIGLSQILALIPGTSRSGITILSAVALGVDRKTAIAFSFIIGLPLILGSFVFEATQNPEIVSNFFSSEYILIGVVSFLFALLTIQVIKRLAPYKFLAIFGFYRILFAVLVILTLHLVG
jgi:undecaprenyl-diphosphatase